MRKAIIVATVTMAVAFIANAGAAAAVSVGDPSMIEVSPPVRSVSYYWAHQPERNMVLSLCQLGRVRNSSSFACRNASQAMFGPAGLWFVDGGGIPVF